MDVKIPSAALKRLKEVAALPAGAPVHVVGGCVRDWLLGRANYDLDLVVDGDPAPLVRALARALKAKAEAFDEFGTHRLLYKGGRVDVARARRERYEKPAALPVVEPAPLREDLYRRDFTINAMAVSVSPSIGALEDPWGGLEDLKAKQLRVLHPESFRDDPTRIFRAARFANRLGFSLEPGTAGWLSGAVAQGELFLLSRERIRQELLRLLAEDDPVGALEKLKGWGAQSAIYHGFDWDESLKRAKDAKVRLGLLALGLEKRRPASGTSFLDSLHLERADGLALKAAVECVAQKAAPKTKLSPLADAVLAAAKVPKVSRSAVLLTGRDLIKAGIKPGVSMGHVLAKLASAQWKGEVTSKAEAVKWLKKTLPS